VKRLAPLRFPSAFSASWAPFLAWPFDPRSMHSPTCIKGSTLRVWLPSRRLTPHQALEAFLSFPRSWDSLFRAFFRTTIEFPFQDLFHPYAFSPGYPWPNAGASMASSRGPAVPAASKPSYGMGVAIALLSFLSLGPSSPNHRENTFFPRPPLALSTKA
jgi:hypothetical protein